MPDTAGWNTLASALRELHRALMESARRDYERERAEALTPGRLLQLLSTDPYFAWLRSLSELMVDIDMIRDAEPELMEELATAVRPAVEHVISMPKTPGAPHPFAEHYWPYVQNDPHVAMAHAGVRQALASWPLKADADAAALLHERHRLSERARHKK